MRILFFIALVSFGCGLGGAVFAGSAPPPTGDPCADISNAIAQKQSRAIEARAPVDSPAPYMEQYGVNEVLGQKIDVFSGLPGALDFTNLFSALNKYIGSGSASGQNAFSNAVNQISQMYGAPSSSIPMVTPGYIPAPQSQPSQGSSGFFSSVANSVKSFFAN